MQRIDSATARPNLFGIGKAGFHDNTDLEGQDATYLSADWLNMIQEELANLLEKNGHALNPESKEQLYGLLATNTDILALADAIEQRFIQVQQSLTNADNALQGQISSTLEMLQNQISNLTTGLATIYPKIRMAGVLGNNGGDGWYEVHKPAGSNINFLDTRFVIQLTYEAKSIDGKVLRREANKFRVYVDVSDRYSGGDNSRRINYTVIESEGVTTSTGNGDYIYTGSEVAFPILPGESKSFIVIGGGGGGGSSRYEDLAVNTTPPILKGADGEDSYIRINDDLVILTAKGGIGGVGGIDSGISGQSIQGTAGTGGSWTTSGDVVSSTPTNGQSGNATSANHTGASTHTSQRGKGGDGADGYATATIGFGGGGGEGGRISAIYTNNTDQTQYCRIFVGKGGIGERSLNTYDEDGELVTAAPDYIAGEDANNGFIRVASAS